MSRSRLVLGVLSVTLLAASLAFPLSQSAWGADKVNYGTALKGVLYYDLPMMAGLEKGFFNQAGLKLNWVPFKSGTQMHRAMAAKAIDIGISSTIGVVRAIVRGTPTKLVAEFPSQSHFLIWVKGDGPIKKPADLKGKKMGISRFGGSGHAFTLSTNILSTVASAAILDKRNLVCIIFKVQARFWRTKFTDFSSAVKKFLTARALVFK